ncbi:hypothetical protein [Chelativorans alearense]|uniref:hypothetical protein n=1 Tax=Chelativorans alearense TaxID=2681495 RepID=UPI0013D08887|nr:hypothetical protein [Chelativorans alearense]
MTQELLRERGEIAKRMGNAVPEALGHPNLTLEQASRIYRLVEKSAQDAGRFVDLMEESDVHESLIKAAEALQDIWSTLSVAAANKVRIRQGLEPIDFPKDDE